MRFLFPDTSSVAGQMLAKTGLIILALVFLGGGGVAAWLLGGAPLMDSWRSKGWQSVTAVLEEVELSDMSSQGVQLNLDYRYQINGKAYRGSRYGLHVWMDNADALRRAYADLLYRSRIQAWVNPDKPEEALLDRDIHWSVVFMALPALGAMLIGFALLWAAGVGAFEKAFAPFFPRRKNRAFFKAVSLWRRSVLKKNGKPAPPHPNPSDEA